MLQVFKYIWDNVSVWGLVALGALAFLFKYGNDKKNEGAHAVIDEINKKNQKVQDAWDKIDTTDPTVDESLNRLRNRTGAYKK